MNIKKGDLVKMIKGKDRGKTGKVTKVLISQNRVVVEGLNMVKAIQKPKRQGEDYNSTEDKERWEAELVKLIQSVILGDFVNILEPSIQGIVAEEFSMSLEADSYQRSAKRTNYRNVYRERKVPIVTEIGPVNISIPKGKKGVSIR